MFGTQRASVHLLFFLLLSLPFTGCLSFEVTTDPSGADIHFDGKYLGKSPCTGHETMRALNHIYTIIAHKEGYQEAIVTFPNANAIQVIPGSVHIPLKPLVRQIQPRAYPQPAPVVKATRTPAAPAGSVRVTRVSTVPAVVPAGGRFDLEVEFTVIDATAGNSSLDVQFAYKIVQGLNVLLTSQPIPLSVNNGESFVRAERGLGASTIKGKYSIEAIVTYKNTKSSGWTSFTIE